MFFMKWRATEMKMYKIMHFVKKVEHILPALDVTARMKWMNAMDENAEKKSLKNKVLSVGLHFQGLLVESVLSI